MIDVKELEELGLSKASKNLSDKQKMIKGMHLAYQNYEWVSQEDVDKFNVILKEKSLEATGKAGSDLVHTYDQLVFVPLAEYEEVPPQAALTKLKTAVRRECFDTFEVAKIASVKEIKDPILFGRVKGCGDRFFVCQWDDDVSIEEIKEAVKEK